MRQWLISHNVIKSDAQIRKEKLQKLVADNYASASDTIWSSWSDSDLRSWLASHGYARTNTEIKRDELVALVNEKYYEANTRGASYLTWPDARLRAYLRSQGMSEEHLPTSRPGLLRMLILLLYSITSADGDLTEEVRIRYVQTSSRLEQIYAKLRALVGSGVSTVEETLGQILELLSRGESKAATYADEKAKSAKAYGDEKVVQAQASKKAAKETVEKKKNEL